jgi:hypothetical protein
LLVLTQNPEYLLPGQPVDRAAFARDLMQNITSVMTGWDVVFKLHPVEVVDDYARAREQTGARVSIVRDFNIVTALLASDAIVSVDISSPCYYARLLGVPQIIFRVRGSKLNDAHVPNFEGVPLIDTYGDLAMALRQLTAGSGLVRAVTTDEGRLDGNASRRIVQELERASS